MDLTHLPAFAIDDEGSQDPDDAVFAEKVEGGFRLFVHVADVAALVPPKAPWTRRPCAGGRTSTSPREPCPCSPRRHRGPRPGPKGGLPGPHL